jgi:hypothetical protein
MATLLKKFHEDMTENSWNTYWMVVFGLFCLILGKVF